MDIPGNARHAAADELIARGFVDPEDGTVPRWTSNGPPVWTNPMQVVDTVLQAAFPHLRPLFHHATEVGRELGRREAGEEIAEELEALNSQASTLACAMIARDVASRGSGASSEPLTGSGVGTGDTEEAK
jgi:hypothetical protein